MHELISSHPSDGLNSELDGLARLEWQQVYKEYSKFKTVKSTPLSFRRHHGNSQVKKERESWRVIIVYSLKRYDAKEKNILAL